MNNLSKTAVRTALIALLGGLCWELFALSLGYDSLITRFLLASIFYAVIANLLYYFVNPKSLRSSLILGAVTPYIAMVLSIFGIWLIFVSLMYFWIFIPFGLLSGYIMHALRVTSKNSTGEEL